MSATEVPALPTVEEREQLYKELGKTQERAESLVLRARAAAKYHADMSTSGEVSYAEIGLLAVLEDDLNMFSGLLQHAATQVAKHQDTLIDHVDAVPQPVES